MSRIFDSKPSISAILGPTNTGKTHTALDRMCEHRNGVIGLPLRLLAREVYERMSARKGRESVALVTGEEKRIPKDARYFVCTTEAMPLDRNFSFVCIDEIQLAADAQRGHVFTDRILRARGLQETLFLGSATVELVLRRLLPHCTIDARPRLSALRYAAPKKLTNLKKRSAIIAFSAQNVYAIAERLRYRHGGAAVVLGALSPRARNAQIELYESGRVDHLVATDAIGMGLNLRIEHAAFSTLEKFDGQRTRRLTTPEMAQIAGRAGRFHNDGTFGTTTDADDFARDEMTAIENHIFPSLRVLQWRNSDLQFDSVGALDAALNAPSPGHGLLRCQLAEDHRTLLALAALPKVRVRATSAAAVKLLWDVACVPDFSKSLTTDHVELLGTVFEFLNDHDCLTTPWIAPRVRRLNRVDGDIGILLARIAAIRVWTFITHRNGWVEDATTWQLETLAIEDRLSDALHEALTLRFVDDRRSVHFRSGPSPIVPVAPPTVFAFAGQRVVSDTGRVIARISRGTSIFDPRVTLISGPPNGPGLAPSIEASVVQWIDTQWRPVREALMFPRAAYLGSPPLRGLLHSIRTELGAVPLETVSENVQRLDATDRRLLAEHGIRIDHRFVFAPAAIDESIQALKSLLWSTFHEFNPPILPGNVTTFDPPKGVSTGWLLALGFYVTTGRAYRIDLPSPPPPSKRSPKKAVAW